MLIVGFLHNISYRRLEEEVRLNMAFKWFVVLDLDDDPPDHSTLTRFRDRLGEDGFNTLFNRLVEMAREQGLVNDRLTIIDSTHVSANLYVARLKKHKTDDDDMTYVDSAGVVCRLRSEMGFMRNSENCGRNMTDSLEYISTN